MKFLVIILSALVVFGCSKRDKTPEILRIYEDFTRVSTSAGACAKPSKEELTNFLANYQMVSALALQKIQEMKPSFSKEQAAEKLKGAGKGITKQTQEKISKEGCDSASIKELVEKFHKLSDWKPVGGS